MKSKKPRYVAGLDSTTTMLHGLAKFLKGQDFPMLGFSRFLQLVIPLANRFPKRVREVAYSISGWAAARPAQAMSRVQAEEISRWVVSLYPKHRQYPAIMIGSSNGALVHLCAALGIPWLPQTFLIPLRQTGIHPDDLRRGMKAAAQPARALLDANQELQLHHMQDPVYDRPMLHAMAYFRIKRLRLGMIYEQFLEKSLEPGGTIILVECQCTRPTTAVDDRHIFQVGGVGGTNLDEYFHGGERVEQFLRRYKSHRRRWDPPPPDGERPESEWGFEPALREDVENFARQKGYRVVRLVFPDPHLLSSLVADLYRWWYRERNIPANRLLVESFFLIEPWWTLRTGSVPFWLLFNTEPDSKYLISYLDRTEPYDYIHMMLLSNAVYSIGYIPIEGWRLILNRARKEGRFVGTDEKKYPLDLASFSRYYTALKDIPSRYPIPSPLSLSQVSTFFKQMDNQHQVEWIEYIPGPIKSIE